MSPARPKLIRIRINGKDYAYEDIAYWDADLKQGRHQRKCIGYFAGDLLIRTGQMSIDICGRTAALKR